MCRPIWWAHTQVRPHMVYRFSMGTRYKTTQEAWVDKLATKDDLHLLKEDLHLLKEDLHHEVALLRSEMKEMELRLKHDLTLRLGGLLAAGIANVAALVKLF